MMTGQWSAGEQQVWTGATVTIFGAADDRKQLGLDNIPLSRRRTARAVTERRSHIGLIRPTRDLAGSDQAVAVAEIPRWELDHYI